MFQFNISPDFRVRTADGIERSSLGRRLAQKLVASLRSVVTGGVAVWAVMVVAGAAMMTHAVHHPAAAPLAPVAAAPAPPPAVDPTPVVAVAPQPAPAPAPAKTTQRVDMTPTGAIPQDPAPKVKHKPHRKKTKDLDTAQ